MNGHKNKHHDGDFEKRNVEKANEAGIEKADLDEIFEKEIGSFGWYHARIIAVCAICMLISNWANNEYVFTTARITTRCQIPECDGENPVFYSSWILNAIPGTSPTSFEDCERYIPLNSTFNPTCPAGAFDHTQRRNCEEHIYENTNTIVYDFGLACDDWRRSLIGSVKIAGYLLALPITGFISDRWGRKVALCINAFNTAWIGITRYWVSTYYAFLVSVFVEAMVGFGALTCAYIIVTELLVPKYRLMGNAFMMSFFSFGQMILGLVAWGIPNWRNLTLALYVPQLLTIFFYFIVDESVRWLITKGKYDECERILRNIATTNKRTFNEASFANLKMRNEDVRKMADGGTTQDSDAPWLPALLWKHKKILFRVIVSPIWWITCILVFYGLSINATNISGNRYANYIAVAFVDVPGFWTSVFLLGRIGRRPVLIGGYWVCCACMIGYIFLSSTVYAASLALYLFSKFSIAAVVMAVYVYTAELYPTPYRHRLFAIASMTGRIGSIVAPLTPALAETFFAELPYILFAVLCFISGALIFLTPETMGTKLPDTMEEASNLQKKVQE